MLKQIAAFLLVLWLSAVVGITVMVGSFLYVNMRMYYPATGHDVQRKLIHDRILPEARTDVPRLAQPTDKGDNK